ncbi:rossmann fold protein [Grosmannia clavigera kw1407]|uniref:Rossmann fold protein n=1 Tax=Grosmannia clavigera (strain kw1407 / UAMH 11150) TaxID=655863 RepID=F0XNR2_GROCL|nr:rossmann fold protein [Grosmannia clavigera kw1407]EFX00573.1 rossmann fold protein [Grosmannia clavigera kw1407]
MATSRRLRVACAGLGRMGKRHALHFLESTPRAHLVAAFSPDPSELAWAKEHLEPFGVRLYSNYEDLLGTETKPLTSLDVAGGLDAIVVATATTVHAEETIQAIEAGLHVLCEKPLSTDLDTAKHVVDVATKHPSQKVLCGFSRRFDASYRDAKAKIDAGGVGRPAILRSQTCDKLDPSGFFVAYAEFSGGIFVDCNIHDIDLALWFFGEDAVIKSVSAVGITAVQPELAKHGDVDNGVGVVEFWGGRIAYFYSSRMMASGQHDMTEIIGTEGKITINQNPINTLVDLWEASGIRREIPPDYYGRFRPAFITEANEFTACCLDNTPLPTRLQCAVSALEIGSLLQESLRSGKKIYFDEAGHRLADQVRL